MKGHIAIAPWSPAKDREIVDISAGSDVVVQGEANPRVLVSDDRAERIWDKITSPDPSTREDILIPSIGAKNQDAVAVSFPFYASGFGRHFQAYEMPLSKQASGGRGDLTATCLIERRIKKQEHVSLRFSLIQQSIIRRPSLEREDEVSTLRQQLVNWLVAGNAELAASAAGYNKAQGETPIYQGPIRRSWHTVLSVWSGRDTKGSPPMRLIVRLANNSYLKTALEHCSRLPRRMLQRVRASQKLEKIQELDAACIRDYARRQGATVREKAGHRRELLAVVRTDTADTHENRVLCWVLEKLGELSREYIHEFENFIGNPKHRDVKRMLQKACLLRAGPEVFGVRINLLTHPASRNYPLQYDLHYRTIYAAYHEILKRKKEVDDAWTWFRVTWSETARQVVYAVLQDLATGGYTSSCYYRSEAMNGRWLASPFAPGPLFLSHVNARITVYDADDARSDSYALRKLMAPRDSLFVGSRLVGATGCDSVMMVEYASGRKVQLLLWCVLIDGQPDEITAKELQQAVGNYAVDSGCTAAGLEVRGLAICLAPKSIDWNRVVISHCFGRNSEGPVIQIVRASPLISSSPEALSSSLSEALSTVLSESHQGRGGIAS